jgi:hypothetical protein
VPHTFRLTPVSSPPPRRSGEADAPTRLFNYIIELLDAEVTQG